MKYPLIEVLRDPVDPRLLHVFYKSRLTIDVVRAVVEVLKRETRGPRLDGRDGARIAAPWALSSDRGAGLAGRRSRP